MKKLSASMPALTQLLTPTTSTVSPSASVTPVIARNPASISFSAIQNGANPSSQTVTVTNSGSGTMNWTAASSVPWLTINGALLRQEPIVDHLPSASISRGFPSGIMPAQ